MHKILNADFQVIHVSDYVYLQLVKRGMLDAAGDVVFIPEESYDGVMSLIEELEHEEEENEFLMYELSHVGELGLFT